MGIHLRKRGPSQYLALRRLAHGLAQLLDTADGSQTVERIATANGFNELGRFAIFYRRYYDETPRETLLRSHLQMDSCNDSTQVREAGEASSPARSWASSHCDRYTRWPDLHYYRRFRSALPLRSKPRGIFLLREVNS